MSVFYFVVLVVFLMVCALFDRKPTQKRVGSLPNVQKDIAVGELGFLSSTNQIDMSKRFMMSPGSMFADD